MQYDEDNSVVVSTNYFLSFLFYILHYILLISQLFHFKHIFNILLILKIVKKSTKFKSTYINTQSKQKSNSRL
jgi:hypothetical protein